MNKQRRSSKNNKKRMLYLYIGYLVMLSISVVLMPIASTVMETTRIPMFAVGLMFWLGLAGTILKALKINSCRKGSTLFNKMYPKEKQLGIVNFFKNKQALVFDILMFVFVIGVIIVKMYMNNIILYFILLGMFVFSFGMHCILNGINYKYIKYGARRVIES